MTGKALPGVWLNSWVKREVGHDTTSFSVVWEDYRVSVWLDFRLNEKFSFEFFVFFIFVEFSVERKIWFFAKETLISMRKREFFSSLVLRNVVNQLFFRLSCGCFSSKPLQRYFLYFVIITNYLLVKLYLSFGVRTFDYERPTSCEPPGHYRNTVADDRTGTIMRIFVVRVRSVRCGQTIISVQKAFSKKTVSRLYNRNVLTFVRRIFEIGEGLTSNAIPGKSLRRINRGRKRGLTALTKTFLIIRPSVQSIRWTVGRWILYIFLSNQTWPNFTLRLSDYLPTLHFKIKINNTKNHNNLETIFKPRINFNILQYSR